MSEYSIMVHGPDADDHVAMVDDTGAVVAASETVVDAIHVHRLMQAASSASPGRKCRACRNAA